MVAWVREEGKASENRQRERQAKEAGKVEFALGMRLDSLRHFRASMIGSTQGLSKRRRCRRCYVFLWVQIR